MTDGNIKTLIINTYASVKMGLLFFFFSAIGRPSSSTIKSSASESESSSSSSKFSGSLWLCSDLLSIFCRKILVYLNSFLKIILQLPHHHRIESQQLLLWQALHRHCLPHHRSLRLVCALIFWNVSVFKQ